MEEKTLTRAEAYRRIARAVYPDEPDEHAAKERVRARANRAVAEGTITRSRVADKKFLLWARDEWPGLAGLEWIPRRTHWCKATDCVSISAAGTAQVLPHDPAELRRRYLELEAERDALQSELADCKRALEEGRLALAEELRRQAEINASKGRRGDW